MTIDNDKCSPHRAGMRDARPDAIDLKILAVLQHGGRLTNAALAPRVGLSPTPCWERLRRLEKAGYIGGYRADIALENLAADVGIGHFGRALAYGMVAVNRTKNTGAPIPFGGVKRSGLGRDGARHGMEAFTETKYP